MPIGTIADRLPRYCAETGRTDLVTPLRQGTNDVLLNVAMMTPEVRQKLRKSRRIWRHSDVKDLVTTLGLPPSF